MRRRIFLGVLLVAMVFGGWNAAAASLFLLPLALVAPPLCSPCCGGGCIIFSDDFSTDRTGTDYTSVSGSWSVIGGVLTTSSASALIVSNTAVTAGLTAVKAQASFTPASTGDIGRLIIAYSNSSNYWFCEVQAGASNGTMKLFQRSGGTNTQQGSTWTISGFNASEKAVISLCYASGMVTAYVTTSSPAGEVSEHAAATITIAGTQCGLATSSISSSATFDDFSISQHAADTAGCGYCDLACNFCSDELPTTIEVTFPSNFYTGTDQGCVPDACCTAINGQTYVLALKPTMETSLWCSDTSTNTICYYEYHELICTGSPCGDGNFYVQIIAYFNSGGGITVVVQEGIHFTGNLISLSCAAIFQRILSSSQVCAGGSWSLSKTTSCNTPCQCAKTSPIPDITVAI